MLLTLACDTFDYRAKARVILLELQLYKISHYRTSKCSLIVRREGNWARKSQLIWRCLTLPIENVVSHVPQWLFGSPWNTLTLILMKKMLLNFMWAFFIPPSKSSLFSFVCSFIFFYNLSNIGNVDRPNQISGIWKRKPAPPPWLPGKVLSFKHCQTRFTI